MAFSYLLLNCQMSAYALFFVGTLFILHRDRQVDLEVDI